MIKIKPANGEGGAPRLGVGVLLISPTGQFLLRHRIAKHGEGTWGCPGGHVEFGEDPTDTAIREVQEEVGIRITGTTFIDFTSDFYPESNAHYVTLCFAARVADIHSVKNIEPDKCDELRWVYADELPDNLFLSTKNLIDKLGPAGLRQTLATFPRAA